MTEQRKESSLIDLMNDRISAPISQIEISKAVSHFLSGQEMPDKIYVSKDSLGRLIIKSDNNLILNHLLKEQNRLLEKKLTIALIALENYSMLLDTWNPKIKVSNTAMMALEKIREIK